MGAMRRCDRGVRAALLAAALAVWGCSDCSLEIATSGLVNGSVGTPYFAELASECGGDVWFLDTGQLPPGIGLQDNGDVEGLPTLAGTFTFVVGVFDFGSEDTAYKGLAITIDPES
jgi:hypothetical protein